MGQLRDRMEQGGRELGQFLLSCFITAQLGFLDAHNDQPSVAQLLVQLIQLRYQALRWFGIIEGRAIGLRRPLLASSINWIRSAVGGCRRV